MIMRRPLLVVLLLAAACGGSKPAAPTSPADLASLESTAGMTGCVPQQMPLTVAIARCTYGQNDVTVATFATDKERDLWLLAAKGSLGGTIVRGHAWAASTVEPTEAASLAAALGGTVTP